MDPGSGQSGATTTGFEPDPPPPPKRRKPPRRLTPAEKAVMLEKRKNAIPEILGPLVETPDGRKMYENYEISLQNGIYTCVTCGFSTGTTYKENWRRLQVIKMHVKAAHLNAYRCHLCEKKFITRKGYELHARTMHPPEEMGDLRLCDLCGKSVSDLDAHLWGHKTPEEKQHAIRSGQGFAILPCEKCGKEFVGFDKLVAHQTIGNRCKGGGIKHPLKFVKGKGSARKLACPTCGKPVAISYLAQHEWTHKNRMEKEQSARLGTAPLAKCHLCDKLVTHSGIKIHLESHKKRGEEEGAHFRCDWEGCNRKFWEETSLIRHKKVDHEGVAVSPSFPKIDLELDLRCPDPACSSRRFTTQFNLQDHIGRRHKLRAERPFQCDICLARFLIRTDLRKHGKNHAPRADFTLTCPQCPCLFARPASLRLHLTVEHSVPKESKTERSRKYRKEKIMEAKSLGERPHKCDICRAGFLLKTDLAIHLKNHRPREDFTITCPHCPALFPSSSRLRLHLTVGHSLPRESWAERARRFREEKRSRGKRESGDEGDANDDAQAMTRSRSKRTKIELIPDEEMEIKEEDCVIQDVLSSEGDDDPTIVEIKSEDEESNSDLDETMRMEDGQEVKNADLVEEEVKIEQDEDDDENTQTTIEGDDEVKVEQDDDDLDESEFFFDYDDFFSSVDLETRDPLEQSDHDDVDFDFCISPHPNKKTYQKIKAAGPPKIPSKESPPPGIQEKTNPLTISRTHSSRKISIEESPPHEKPGFKKTKKKTHRFKISHILPHTFKCPTCNRSYAKEEPFLRHLARGHPFTCTAPPCSATFDTERARNAHLKTTHPGAAAYACALCPRKFNHASSLAMHMVIRHETGGKKFPCDKCAKGFALEENLARHVSLHKFEAEKPLICDVCDSRFEDDARLQRHVETHNAKRFTCTECEASFSLRQNLERHVRLRHTGEKPEKCDHCEASFIDKYALARHVGVVHTQSSHICHVCGKSFPLLEYLNLHVKRTHVGSRAVKCDTCAEKFADYGALKSHRIREHGEDPWVCHECGTTFTTPHGFRLHMKGHRGEKPHKCDLCDARFLTKRPLLDHRRTHTGERPFPCRQCEYAFKSKKTLRNHVIRMHTPGYVTPTPHKCPHCEKRFKSVSLLNAHVRQVHTGERPFVCDQDACGSAFARKRYLTLHLRNTHKVGERKSGFKLPSRKRAEDVMLE